MYRNTYPPPEKPRGRPRSTIAFLLSKNLWKRVLFCTVYFSASLVILNDLFLMMARTFIPGCFPGAKVVILETLLQSITKIISAGV